MPTLVFLRFLGEKFEDGLENLKKKLIESGMDLSDSSVCAAFFDNPVFDDGTHSLPEQARWSTIINTPATGLNVLTPLAKDAH